MSRSGVQITNEIQKALPSYNILLMGDQSVGKTSFVDYLENRVWPPRCQPTIGIEFNKRTATIQNQKAVLNCFDVGGQKRFRELSDGYFRGKDGYVIFYDVSNPASLNDVNDWVQRIARSLKDDSAKPLVYLVGNKTDLPSVISEEEEKRVRADIQQKLNLDVLPPIFKMSLKNGQGVKEFCDHLASALPVKAPKMQQVSIKDSPSFWSRYHRGMIAAAVVASLLLIGLAIAIPLLWPVLILASVTTLAMIAAGAAVTTVGLTVLAGWVGQTCFQKRVGPLSTLSELEYSVGVEGAELGESIGLNDSVVGHTQFSGTYERILYADSQLFDSPADFKSSTESGSESESSEEEVTLDESYVSGSESSEEDGLWQGVSDGKPENVLQPGANG